MNSQFRKGVIEMCVLTLVSHKDCYGYELIEAISKQVEVSEGTIYPILRRLTKEGFFETYLRESSEGPSRKYYKITSLGKKQAQKTTQAWLDFNKRIQKVLKG